MTTSTKRNFFYKAVTVAAVADFPDQAQVSFGFTATRVIIANDHEDSVLSWSFLKPNLDGELKCVDGPIAFDGLAESRIWFKATANPTNVRVWAWRA